MILAVLNQKGGAGKTVLSTNLAVAFQRSGARVVLIDSDFQGSTLLWRALAPEDYPEVIHATTPDAIEKALEEAVSRREATVTIIDGAAQVQQPMATAVASATHVLVPVTPSALDMWAAGPLLEVARLRRQRGSLRLGLVINQFEQRTNISQNMAQTLLEVAPDVPVIPTRVAKRVAYREAVSRGLSVLDLPRARRAAEEIISMATDILEL